MEEEVRKHIKNIYKGATNPGHSFMEKLKEVSIEIFIIVFAVTLSIWLHNWSEHRHEKKVAAKFLNGLRSDLMEDMNQIERNKSTASRLLAMYDTLFQLPVRADASAKDDSSKYNFFVDILTTRPNIGRYEGFKSSGKMETIENDGLRQKILAYFQQTIPDLAISEGFINSVQLKILDQEIDMSEKMSVRELITSRKVKAILHVGMQNFESTIRAYDSTLSNLRQIISEIEQDTKD